MKIICTQNIKESLDSEQLEAVESPLGNTCVFAIAGSGKTRTLTYRVANMINNGIRENNIMLLTFTNKAANEMIERIKDILDKDILMLIAGTFHSVAVYYLREYCEAVHLKNDFSIIDTNGQKIYMKKAIESYVSENPDKESIELPSKEILLDIYSGSINHNIELKTYTKDKYDYDNNLIDISKDIIYEFKERKLSDNVLDFDDIIVKFMNILEEEYINKQITNKIKHILVDEYQDINFIQHKIIKLLNKNNSLFAIGDTNQCIYQFRGSDEKYIETFKYDYSNTQKYSITYNYRSSPEILNIAEQSINQGLDNENTIELKTFNTSLNKPLVFNEINELSQANRISFIIKNNFMDSLDSTAILVRKRSQIPIIEKYLRFNNIPYDIKGTISFYDTEHIKDILSILQFIKNPENLSSFQRFTKILPGVGKVSSDKIYSEIKKNGVMDINEEVGKKIKESVLSIKDIYSQKNTSIPMLINYIFENYYEKYLNLKFTDFKERTDDIQFLIKSSIEFKSLNDFLDSCTLETTSTDDEIKGKVTLLTVHKSKGLEWDNVFIPTLNDDIFPMINRNLGVPIIKNERKLFYVAVTRAKKQLIMSFVATDFTKNKLTPSIFLKELDRKLYDFK